MAENTDFKKAFIQRLIRFSLSIIRLCDTQIERKYHAINDQVIRSATSVGANVVEAKASSSRKEYIKYFEIALKSAHETAYWLILCRELRRSEQKHDLETYLQEIDEIIKVLTSSILTLKGEK